MPVRAGTASQINTPWQSFETADRPLMVAVGNDKQFAQFCAVVGLPELPADPRFATNRQRMAHKPELLPLLQGALLQRPAGEWVDLLNTAGISSGPLNDFGAAVQDPQLRHRGMWQDMPHPRAGSMPFVANPVRFSETPVAYRRAPPQLGEHTAEVMAEWLGTETETPP
jgi:crotonobetainyl-CoA:carnitine CoA-transferase CaiB-like acyl-CoA transferase